MASGFRLEVNDRQFTQLLNEYKRKATEVGAIMDRELAATGEDMVRSAKNLVSSHGAVDTGRLLNSISFRKDQFLSYQFVAQTDYAAYIEFGTGNRFITPENNAWAKLAGLFKGRGIKQVNLPPRPYMRPSILAYWPLYQKKVKELLKKKKKV